MSGPSASGTDLAKNNFYIIDNGIDHFDFAPYHVVIQALESASIQPNFVLEKKNKILVYFTI